MRGASLEAQAQSQRGEDIRFMASPALSAFSGLQARSHEKGFRGNQRRSGDGDKQGLGVEWFGFEKNL